MTTPAVIAEATKAKEARAEILAPAIPAEFQDNTLINIFEKVKTEVLAEVQDITTVNGRKAIRDNVKKVTATRNAIDEKLRNYLRELKAQPRIIEKSARENLQRYNDLGAELLVDMQKAYEPQQAALDRLDAIAAGCSLPFVKPADLEAAAEELDLFVIDNFWEESRPKARKRIKEVKEAVAAAIVTAKEAQAREEEIERLRAEKEAAEREAHVARLMAQREAEAQQAIERAKIEAQQAVERIKQEQQQRVENALKAAEMAAKIERQKIEAQQEQERQAAAEREADQANRIAKNREALADFIAQGIDEEMAKKVITLIAKKKIKNIFINY